MRHLLFRVLASAACVALLALGVTVAFAQGEQVTATLTPVSGSGVTGTASIQPEGNQTRITVAASGLTPGSRHSVFFGFGTCASMPSAALQFTIGDIVAGADGAGSVSATVATTIGSLLQNGPNQVHINQTTGNPIIACANVPSPSASVTPTSLPSTGGVPLGVIPSSLLGLVVLSLGLYLRRH